MPQENAALPRIRKSLRIIESPKRRRIMIGVGGLSFFLVSFAVVQFVGYWFIGDRDLVARGPSLAASGINFIMGLAGWVFLAVNRRYARSERIFSWSLHAASIIAMTAWIAHIHIAGTQNTLLALLIPATSIIVMWVLNRFWAWFYWAAASLALYGVVALELSGRLAYFPLATHGSELTPLFFDSRFLLMNAVLYLICSVAPMGFVAQLHRDLEVTTEALIDAKTELEILATTDSLTGLLLRRAILPRLQGEIARAQREGRSLCVVILDIDNFKSINDTHGHAAGDEALRGTAAALRRSFRPYDLIARIGGEEFLVVLPDNTLDRGVELAERARAHLKEECVALPDDRSLRWTASFGVAAFEAGQSVDVDTLIRRADEAHYFAKRSGKDRVVAAKD